MKEYPVSESLNRHMARFEEQISRREKRTNPQVAAYFRGIWRLLAAIRKAEASEDRHRKKEQR